MPMSELPLFDLSTQPTASITRLYEQLELFSEGEVPHNALFVLGRPSLAEHNPLQAARDQLLIIDPPADLGTRFRIDGDAAVLYTGNAPANSELPQVQTQAGGVAHIRIGSHFLDIYSQAQSNIVYLPALGILCGGSFGSDTVVPTVATESDGSEELAVLRLLAQLVKQRSFQIYIPHVGTVVQEMVEAMKRLAADVAYLNRIRHAMQEIVARSDSAEVVETIAPSLLPEARASMASEAIHLANLEQLYKTFSS